VRSKELGAEVLVLDDAAARRLADAEGFRVVGLLGLLIDAQQRGVIPEVRPVVDEMRAAGFFLDEARYQLILRRAGE